MSETRKSIRRDANWDRNNLLKNYTFNIVTQFSSAIVSFITVWAISKYSGTEVLAITIAVTAGSQAILLFSNWTSLSLIRLGAEEFIKTKAISTIFSARASILFVNLGLIIFFYPLWGGYLLNLLKLPDQAGYYLLVQFILVSLLGHFTASFQAVKLLRVQGLLLLTEKCLSLGGIIFFFFFYDRFGWQDIMVAYLVSSGLVVFISFFLIRSYYRIDWDLKHVKQVLRFSLPLLPYSLTAFLTTNYLDTFFITRYLKKNDLSVYSIAYQFYGFWLQLPTILGTLMLPMFITYMVHNKLPAIERYLTKHLHIFVLVWSFLSAILAYLLTIFIPLLFKNINHPQLNNILITFMLGTAFAIPNFIGYAPYSMTRKVVFFSFPFAIITAGVNFLGNRFLIAEYGLVGCTYASVLSIMAGFLAGFLFTHYYFKVSTAHCLLAMFPALVGIFLCFYGFDIKVALLACLILSGLLLVVYKDDFKTLILYVREQVFKRNPVVG